MKKHVSLGLALAAFAALGACSSTESQTPPPANALRTGNAADEAACDLAVAKETNNGETIVLSSEFSEANTIVIVGVGPNKAKWKCLVKDGKVAEVSSLTDEGI